MTQEERDNLLLEMQKDNKKRDELLLGMQNNLLEMQDKLEVIHANIGSLDERFGVLENKVDDLSGSVILMEKEHGDKIQLLLDIASDPYKDYNIIKERVDSHKSRLYEHDIRIRVLESKVGNS